MLSFSTEEFLLVLESYNLSIWPLQIIAYFLIGLVLFLLFKQTLYSTKIVIFVLSLFWLFNGVVFSLIYWAPSHFFGYGFGILCFVQGLLFLYSMKYSDITIGTQDKTYTLIGLMFVFYAIIGYQILGYFLGHIYPQYFPAGLVPCPTTILTFGIFLIINNKIPFQYYVIPLVISIGGFLAVYNGIFEDLGLILAGILGTIYLIRKESQVKIRETQTT